MKVTIHTCQTCAKSENKAKASKNIPAALRQANGGHGQFENLITLQPVKADGTQDPPIRTTKVLPDQCPGPVTAEEFNVDLDFTDTKTGLWCVSTALIAEGLMRACVTDDGHLVLISGDEKCATAWLIQAASVSCNDEYR